MPGREENLAAYRRGRLSQRQKAALRRKRAQLDRDQAELKQLGFVGASEKANERERAGQARRTALKKRQQASDPGSRIEQAERRAQSGKDRPSSAAILSGVPGGKFTSQALAEIGEAAIYAPAGVAEIGKAVGKDVYDVRKGDLDFGRSRTLAAEIGRAMYGDIRHPLRHPGYTILTALGALSAGASVGSRATAAASAARTTGAKAALTRPGYEGGSLLRRPAPKETTLTIGTGKLTKPLEVHRLEPDNPLFRPAHRLRTKLMQRRIDNPPTEKAKGVGGLYQKFVSPENLVGREVRARRRVEAAAAKAPAEAVRRSSKKLSHDEQTALRLVAIEGSHALKHPDEVAGRHAKRHADWAKEGIEPELNLEIARDIAKAAKVLRGKDPEFLRAVAQARRLSKRGERDAAAHRLLKPEDAAERRVSIAAEYGRTFRTRQERQRDRTAAEVQARLSKLDTARVVDAIDPYTPEAKRLETAHRNRGRGKRARGKAIRPTNQRTVNAELRAEAEQQIATVAEKNPATPQARLLRERDQLRAKMTELGESSIEGTPPPSLGTVTTRFDRFGAPHGSFYFPTGERFKLPPRQTKGKAYSPSPSELGFAKPQHGRFTKGTFRRFTGKGLRRGVVERPGEAIAEAYTGRQRFYSASDLYRESLRASTDKRTSEFQIPLRRPGKISPELRRQIETELEKGRHGDESAFVRAAQLAQDSLKATEHLDAPIGRQVPGVRWVDERVLKQLEQGPQIGIQKAAAAVNKPFRFLGVYLRPAYLATNYPSNWAMAAVTQGAAVGKNWVRATIRSRKRYGDDNVDWLESVSGTGRTESYQPRGRVSRAERAVVHGVTRATDRDFRVGSLLYRAEEKGYKGKDGITRLRTSTDEKVVKDRAAITRRARKDAVDFDSLTPEERQLVEAIYFYPWVSRATAWTGRAAVNRPVKTAALAGAAREAEQREVGPVPRWLRGWIPSRFGLSNPGPLNTAATPAQLLEFAQHPRRGESLAEELGTPILQLAAGDVRQAPGRLIGSTGLGGLLKRAGVDHPLLGRPSKTFPDRGLKEAVGPFTLGGPFPRRPDEAEVAKQARRDLREDMNPPERAQMTVRERRARFWEEAKRVAPDSLEKGQLPRSLRAAFEIEARRQAEIARAREGTESKTREFHKARYDAELALLVRYGQITPERRREMLVASRASTMGDFEAANTAIVNKYWRSESRRGQLYVIGFAKKALEEQGAEGLD